MLLPSNNGLTCGYPRWCWCRRSSRRWDNIRRYRRATRPPHDATACWWCRPRRICRRSKCSLMLQGCCRRWCCAHATVIILQLLRRWRPLTAFLTRHDPVKVPGHYTCRGIEVAPPASWRMMHRFPAVQRPDVIPHGQRLVRRLALRTGEPHRPNGRAHRRG